jgi:glutamate/tyrosine decarboxylase-like PLP-dependent enzyme
LRAAFKVPLAENGRDPQQVIEALADAAEPGLMGNTGSNFFGWVMGASSPVGMAADLLTAAWGQNAAIYQTSPAAAMAEEAVAQWLLDVRLPREFGRFATGATMATSRRRRARCAPARMERRRRRPRRRTRGERVRRRRGAYQRALRTAATRLRGPQAHPHPR